MPQTSIPAFESLECDISVSHLGMEHEAVGIVEQIVLNQTMHDIAVTVLCVNSIVYHLWPGQTEAGNLRLQRYSHFQTKCSDPWFQNETMCVHVYIITKRHPTQQTAAAVCLE